MSADSLMWLFAFDDAHCDEGALGRDPAELSRVLIRLLRVLEAPEAPIALDSPYRNFELALRDLHGRLASFATPVQVGRWLDAMRMYFLCQVWEAADRVERVVPDLSDYAFLRIHNGAMRVSVMLLDIADGYELPAAEMDRPEVRALTETTCLLVGWDNDILSFSKEHTSTQDAAGLLDVLSFARGDDVAGVLDEAMLLRDSLMVLFERLSRQVLPTASADLRRYVASLGHWIRANLEWGMTCERYRDPDDPSPLRVRWAHAPAPHSEEPVRIPAIAWWWQQLR
ncbi:terpene synthase family protein [Streptomyces sp. E-15]